MINYTDRLSALVRDIVVRVPGLSGLNPDELLNQDVKTNALGKSPPTSRAEMIASVRSHLHRRQKQPQLI